MSLRDQMAADMQWLISEDELGDSVIYRLPDGTQSTLTAMVFDMATEPRDITGVSTLVSSRGCTFRTADIGDVNIKASVIVDGVAWAIDGVVFADDQQTTVVLQRHELLESTRPGYRKK